MKDVTDDFRNGTGIFEQKGKKEPESDLKRLLGGYFFAKAGRDKAESEKAVLPAIIFVSASHPNYEEFEAIGFTIAIGWWDWSIKFGWFKPFEQTA